MEFFRALTPLWMSLNDEHCNALSKQTSKQTKNTSGKKLKYHGVPEGGASRTSKGATDSPACRAALGHYSSGGWGGAVSGH